MLRYERLQENEAKKDQRGAAQRDRDRVLYTSYLRRLSQVTQVVSPEEGVIFHNRLTHTLEVAQIGRRIAEMLLEQNGERVVNKLGGLNPEIVETAALAHDLGHPPYGHAVEEELDQIVRLTHKVTDGYEGNAQSFRIVNRLATRDPDNEGLNLTRASLNAVLKYPWLRGEEPTGKTPRKFGVYRTEHRHYAEARRSHSGLCKGQSLEAQIMDWADDVAYAVHDLDDFYRAGLVPLDRMRNKEDGEFKYFLESMTPDGDKDALSDTLESIAKSSPAARRYKETIEERKLMRRFTSSLVDRFVRRVKLAGDVEDPDLLIVPEDAKRDVALLKDLTKFYVISHPSLKLQQHGQREVVANLFRIYWTACKSPSKDEDRRNAWEILPEDVRIKLNRVGDGIAHEDKVRTIADLIASMTERQLIITHSKLTGTTPGSISDLIY
jgi:dGTPase